MPQHQYLTKGETANLMRCSVVTLNRIVNDGLLRKIKLRGKVLFAQTEINAFLNGSAAV